MSTPNEGPAKRFLSLPEVQSYLGIKSRKTILKYISAGKLPAYKIGGTRWRFDRADVETFLSSHSFNSDPDLSHPRESGDTESSVDSRLRGNDKTHVPAKVKR